MFKKVNGFGNLVLVRNEMRKLRFGLLLHFVMKIDVEKALKLSNLYGI